MEGGRNKKDVMSSIGYSTGLHLFNSSSNFDSESEQLGKCQNPAHRGGNVFCDAVSDRSSILMIINTTIVDS